MSLQELNAQAERYFLLAHGWHKIGKIQQAITSYKSVIHLQPEYIPAYLKLASILLQEEDLEGLIDIYSQAIKYNPNEAELHKNFINAIINKNGIEAAFDYYQLSRKDNKEIEIETADILCCVVVRNESLRLPYFLDYYREKGINKFLIIDNDSTDDTQSYLLTQPDVYLWHSTYSFNQANFGSVWFELLLRKYGVNHWCLTLDADEILYYPDCETKSIRQLCKELDRKNKKAFNAVLLDMYSDKAIKDTNYTKGENFLEVCPYFDKNFYHRKYEQAGTYKNQTVYFGGVRERVFGTSGEYYLSKVPLLKYSLERVLAGGQHFTNCSQAEIALESGCLLHFKYFSSFINYVQEEVVRKEHYGEAMQYAEYVKVISQNSNLSLYDSYHSVKLQNSQQLVELGIIQTEDIKFEFPQITPLIVSDRPKWSVMITVYNRLHHIEQALRSVIEQAPSAEEMQIEVINDGADKSIQDKLEAIVKNIGGDRVNFYKHPCNVGHPHIFNICIEQARGHWVHILHDDDWVKPGFYRQLEVGFQKEPHIGAAFCRQLYIDNEGLPRLSPRERETPGIINNWLEQIAVFCRVQFSAMVVKRDVYEKLGGFCPQTKSVFDWDMWKRIAVHYSFWYEPETLVCFKKDTSTETSGLLKSGGQIADTRRSIEISRCYLPSAVSDELSNKALQNYAEYGLNLARQQLMRSEYQAALANSQEALKCSPSPQVEAALISLLAQIKNNL